MDVECFLLSGLKADETIAAEMAFMYGERELRPVEFPVGGSEAIVAALVDAIEARGGKLRLRSHVEKIRIQGNEATGVELKSGEFIGANVVISNASIWDTYGKLIDKTKTSSR